MQAERRVDTRYPVPKESGPNFHLLGVVAVDDVIGILLFSLVVPFVGEATLGSSLGAGTLSIAGGLALGIAGGWLLAVAARRLTEDHLLV